MQAMQFDFSPKQFQAFLQLVYIGNTVASAFRRGRARLKKYDELEQQLLQRAAEAGVADWVEYDAEENQLFPTEELEDGEAGRLLAEYDNGVFWDELAHRLAERDVERLHGRLPRAELERLKRPLLAKYRAELDFHGLQNLELRQISPREIPVEG